MRTKWRDLVITDYEQSFADMPNEVLSVYSQSLLRAPSVLLGATEILGIERRPGIVDTDQGQYDTFMGRLSSRLCELDGVRRLASRYEQRRAKLAELLNSEVAVSTPVPWQNTENALIEVMSFHVLNWAMPRDRHVEWLNEIFRDDRAAMDSFLTIIGGGTPSHVFLKGAGFKSARLRQSKTASSTAAVTAELVAVAKGLEGRRIHVRVIREAWRLAAREEEERKVLQERWVSLINQHVGTEAED